MVTYLSYLKIRRALEHKEGCGRIVAPAWIARALRGRSLRTGADLHLWSRPGVLRRRPSAELRMVPQPDRPWGRTTSSEDDEQIRRERCLAPRQPFLARCADLQPPCCSRQSHCAG